MAVYLHIRADFDENGLSSKVYTSLDEFVNYKSEQFTKFKDLVEYINKCADEGEKPEYVEKYLYDLINDGYAEGEWDSEEFHEVKGTVSLGVVI